MRSTREVVDRSGVSGTISTRPPAGLHQLVPDDFGGLVVAALHQHVGPDRLQHRERGILVKDRYRIDVGEGGEQRRALGLRHQRPLRLP